MPADIKGGKDSPVTASLSGAGLRVEIDIKGLHDALLLVDRLRRSTAPLPTLGEALNAALRLENNAAEYHYRTALGKPSPEIANLINGLGRADKEHCCLVEDFAKARGFA